MRILGIDQSFTKCGLVILNEEDEVLDFKIISADNKKDKFDQAFDIATMIGLYCMEHEPNIIVLEGLAFGMSGNATRDLAGLQFTIVNHLRHRGYSKIKIVSPKTIKKHATGNGGATKQELYECLPNVVQSLFEERGYKKTTGRYDLTDAFWLAQYVNDQNLKKVLTLP